MAAPVTDAGEFESWLNDSLDSLEVDREVYGAYILGVLQEEESDEEKEDALQGILSAFLVNIWSGMSRSATEAVLSHVLLSVLSARVVQSDSADVSCHLWKVLSTLNAAVFLQLQSRRHRQWCWLFSHATPSPI